GRGKAAAVERNERAKIRWNDRDLGQNHPLRLVAGLQERLDQLDALGELLRLELGGGLLDLDAEVGRHLLKIERLQHLADRFSADQRGEAIRAVLVLRLEVLVLGQELTVL